jgi:putative heme-binding domain-containing protein
MLGRLALKDSNNPNMLVAIKSSATQQPAEILNTLLSGEQSQPDLDNLIQHLVGLTVVKGSQPAVVRAIESIARPQGKEYRSWQIAAFAELLRELDRQKISLSQLKANAKGSSRESFEQLTGLQAFARRTAEDNKAPMDQRLAAIQLLGREKSSEAQDILILGRLLSPGVPTELHSAAIVSLGQIQSSAVAVALLDKWKTYNDTLRSEVLELLTRREESINELLNRIERKQLSSVELGVGVRQQLVLNKNATVRERATKLFSLATNAERQALIDKFLPQVQGATPRTEHGSLLFAQQCSICHRLAGVGTGSGPDLASLVDKTVERMLIAILDPNRAVEDRYKSYLAETKADEEFVGMLVNETGNSVTLVGVTGVRQTILRSDLKSLTCTQKSLMPEGFETSLKPQDLADLIAYIGSVGIAPKTFPGNRPELILTDKEGQFRLLASNGEIYGDSLTLESQHNNLGFWNSSNDRVTWTVDVPKNEKYDVWLVWSCDDGAAGNSFRLQIEESKVIGKVPGTGTWDNYKHEKFGQLELSPGKHKISLRPEGEIKNYLLDLREIRLVPSSRKSPPQFSSTP